MELHVFYDRRSYENGIDTIPTGLIVWVENREIVEWYNGERRTGSLPIDYEFNW
jgi:hypothetical protein